MADIYETAGVAFKWFETRTRDNGDNYVTLKDGRPEWLHDLVHAAHGDMLPDDWRYESIRSALGFIHDNEPDDLDDGHEFADGNVDTYNGARVAWLGSGQRSGYCDEAADDGLVSAEAGIFERIGAGQYVESLEVWALVVESLTDYVDSLEDE